MPRGDGTGPGGMGPMTGRGMGFCAGYNTPGYTNPGFGRGMGFGAGRGFGGGGRGRRNWFYATGMPGWSRAAQGLPAWGAPGYAAPGYGVGAPFQADVAPEQELEALKEQSEYLKGSLDEIAKRIKELEDSAENK